MLYNHLSKNDCQKILEFFDTILVPVEHFRKQVLISLSQLFGYHKSIFWLADKHGNLYDPFVFNVKDSVINDYVDHFAQLDVLHPQKNFDMFSKSNVLRIHDIMSFDDYEKNEYYSQFMRKHGEYDEMGVCFLEGKKLLGAIGFSRSKHEKRFHSDDIKRLSVISKQISKTLVNNSLLEDIDYQKKLFEVHSNMSSIGMIVIDAPSHIRYVNPAARDICSELTPKSGRKNPVEYFAEHFLAANYPNWQTGLVTTILLPSLQEVTVHVSSVPANKSVFDIKQYIVYLIPTNQSMSQSFAKDNMQCELTSKEREVFRFVQKGLTNSEIASEMFISVNTVKSHLKNIYKKMNVRNRTSLCNKIHDAMR